MIAALVQLYREDLGLPDDGGRTARAVTEWLQRLPWFYRLGLRLYLKLLELVGPRFVAGPVEKLLKSLTYLSLEDV